jgi:hypothetical protein
MDACNNIFKICPVCDNPESKLVKTGDATQAIVGLAFICPECYFMSKDRLIQSTEIADGVSGVYTSCPCAAQAKVNHVAVVVVVFSVLV